MDETQYNAAVKSIAAMVVAILAAASHVLGLSPTFASAHFLDLITSAISTIASIAYAIKHRRRAPPPAE